VTGKQASPVLNWLRVVVPRYSNFATFPSVCQLIECNVLLCGDIIIIIIIIIRNVVHTVRTFGFYISNYKKSVPKTLSVECSWSCLVTYSTSYPLWVQRYSTRCPCAVPAASSGSGCHKKPSSLGTISSAV